MRMSYRRKCVLFCTIVRLLRVHPLFAINSGLFSLVAGSRPSASVQSTLWRVSAVDTLRSWKASNRKFEFNQPPTSSKQSREDPFIERRRRRAELNPVSSSLSSSHNSFGGSGRVGNGIWMVFPLVVVQGSF